MDRSACAATGIRYSPLSRSMTHAIGMFFLGMTVSLIWKDSNIVPMIRLTYPRFESTLGIVMIGYRFHRSFLRI